ncbi:MAG TPA: hypothetical protein ENG03_07945 [Thioploca sp.]|nr:hypothetical protein [Thioploca sp.]
MRTIYLVIFTANMPAAPQTQRDALVQAKHYCQQKGIENHRIAAQTLTGDTLLQAAENYQHSGHYQESIAVLCIALENTSADEALRKTFFL